MWSARHHPLGSAGRQALRSPELQCRESTYRFGSLRVAAVYYVALSVSSLDDVDDALLIQHVVSDRIVLVVTSVALPVESHLFVTLLYLVVE